MSLGVWSVLEDRCTLEGELGAGGMAAHGRGRLLPVEALRELPEHDECMRTVNWPTDAYVHAAAR